MTKRSCFCLGLLVAVGLLMTGGSASAIARVPAYRLIDLGTLGGLNSFPNTPGIMISPSGAVVGSAETPALNPFGAIPGYACSSPCLVADAFMWRDGVMTDLGTLGGYSSGLFELNGSGDGAGFSETGALDPLTAFPEAHAAISEGGRLTDLGTLGGYESWATGINSRGEVSGFASNSTPDPYAQLFSPYPTATQLRAVIWHGGKARDLGTLGGPDSIGGFLDGRGDAAGESFTNSTPNATTGIPTMDPFLWRNGVMHDLGGLGGVVGMATWMNNHGQVVGGSDLAGDQAVHPFLWNGHRLVDLGTLGGDFAVATWVNDPGSVVGFSAVPGNQAYHAFLWKHGIMQDLPPTDADLCSGASAINARGQVVGAEGPCFGESQNAMLWENGSGLDLNTLIAPSPLHLTEALFIAANGEIASGGILPNGEVRLALLTPTAASAGGRFARASRTNATAATESTLAQTTPNPFAPAATGWRRLALIAKMRLR
jgi:probable HAF family extracellular repeat protein